MSEIQDREPGVLAAGRHPVNIGHLVMGLAFLGLVGIWSLIVNDVVGDEEIRWLLPVPWVLAGLGGLVALAVSGSRRYATRATGWVDSPPAEADVDQDVDPDVDQDVDQDPAEDLGTTESGDRVEDERT